jgi:uncharacterized protein (TIGR03437 family)
MNYTTRLFRSGISRAGLCLATAMLSLLLAAVFVTPVSAATFGTVVTIGGQASDIALDEPRGRLYIANFTANRIDVMSLASNTIQTSFHVAPQPGSLALSPDGNYLVVVHFGNFIAPLAPTNALTVIGLNNNNAIQTFALGDTPLGVAFGVDGLALIVTTTNFLLFDPTNGQLTVLDTIANVTANTLPVPPANFPPNIISASLNVSADGFHVYGLTNTIFFHYSVLSHSLQSLYFYTASPTLGPLAVSVANDGSFFTAGWSRLTSDGIWAAQFPNALGTYNLGSTAIDSSAGLIYAQIPQGTAQSTAVPPTFPATSPAPQGSVAPPILQVVASDNLSVQQNLQIPENLGGKSLLTAKRDMLYSISESGVTVFPVGYLASLNRVQASQADVVFRGNLCNSNVVTQKIAILDPGGNQTDFALTPSIPGITLSQYAGTTPATITVSVDPSAFQNLSGTVTGSIAIQSNLAINVPNAVRVLINGQGPDQRGAFINVPGTLVDVLADPVRNRFYVLRQDQDQVLVYDATGQNQLAVLRTSNTPTSMAITMDRNYLLVGHDNSQLIYVFNLNTLRASAPIVMPSGHYPRSVAVSSNGILAASRVSGPTNTIDVVDFWSRSAYTPTTLGIFQNSINIDTALSASPGGRYIFGASADGTTLLYDASVGSFIAGRKDFTSLSGAHSASDYGQFIADVNLLNSSLVLTSTLDSSIGGSSGAAFSAQLGFRTTAPKVAGAPGVIEHVDPPSNTVLRPTNMVEAPLLHSGSSVFTRTLAPLSDHSALVSLTTSGFTLLPWSYDAAVTPPNLTKVVNAADFTSGIAPGGLISVMGSNLSPVNMASSEIPLPTVLGQTCLMVNGAPIPMLYVSNKQINAELPFEVSGSATMVLYTPGGISRTVNLTIQSNAPSVFRSGTAGPQTGIPTVMRNSNHELVTLSNPIHSKDKLTIYATGLGTVTPPVADGAAGLSNPLAVANTPASVTLGGTSLNVEYAGLAPGMVGVYAIVAVVPGKTPTGLRVPLIVTQGGATTTLQVRVVK